METLDRTLPNRLPIATEPTAVSPAEQFQNQTLRPILKLLDHSIHTFWRHHLPKRKTPFDRFTKQEKLAHIERAIREDTRLRLHLVGMVLGHFTSDEWTVFMVNESEITRRLLNLLIERLQSQET